MKTILNTKTLTNLKALGLASTVALATASCTEYAGNFDQIGAQAKAETKDLLFKKGISAKEWEQLEKAEKNHHNSIWNLNNQMEIKHYWDSIKTKALVDEAYYKGAQAIRDSIKNLEK